MDGIGVARLLPKECCSWQEKGLRREEIGPIAARRFSKLTTRRRHGGSWTVAWQSWIADKLAMRSAANVSQQVRRYRARRSRLPPALKEYLQSVKIC